MSTMVRLLSRKMGGVMISQPWTQKRSRRWKPWKQNWAQPDDWFQTACREEGALEKVFRRSWKMSNLRWLPLLPGTTNAKILAVKKLMQMGQTEHQSGELCLPSDKLYVLFSSPPCWCPWKTHPYMMWETIDCWFNILTIVPFHKINILTWWVYSNT